jgi:hypothetical protein
MISRGYSKDDYNAVIYSNHYMSSEIDKFSDNINKVLSQYNEYQQKFINDCLSKMNGYGYNNYFSYKRIAECCPEKPINNLYDYIKYLENRGYTLDKIEYCQDYILGLPEYDVYCPQYIHMKYKNGSKIVISIHLTCDEVFSISDENNIYTFNDLGSSINNRRFEFSDIKYFDVNFPYYPELIGTNNFNIYGAKYPWEMSIILLDYFEDCIAYTNRYMVKCQNIVNYINNEILPILKEKGYDYEVSSFNSSNGVYIVKDTEWGKNIFDITLYSEKTDNRICFSLSKLSMSPKLFVSNHVNIMTECHRLEDVFVDDLTTDEIIELIDTCNNINNNNKDQSVYGAKAQIVRLYNLIKKNPNDKDLLDMKLVKDMPNKCKEYVNDPEIGIFVDYVLKWINKVIPKIVNNKVTKKSK